MYHDHPEGWQALQHARHHQLWQEAEEWRLLRQARRRMPRPPVPRRLASALGEFLVTLGYWLKGLDRPVL